MDDDDFIYPLIKLTVESMDRGETFADFQPELATLLAEIAPHDMRDDPDALDMLGCVLARSVWAATPNPSRQFQIEKLPPLGRNDRCVIGRACKHKQCCGALQGYPPMDAMLCWTTVCEVLPANRMPAILESGRLPAAALVVVASRLVETNPARVEQLLAPRFAGTPDPRDKHLGELLLILCDTYDALSIPEFKVALLERMLIIGKGDVRLQALQRLATVCSDQGDYDRAWQLFAEAIRVAPNDPALSHLEIIMLIGDGRADEARQRARHWITKLERRAADYDLESILAWLQTIADGKGLESAMANVVADRLDPVQSRFIQLLEKALSLPADPQHVLVDTENTESTPLDLENVLVRRLTSMGLPKAEARAQATEVIARLAADTDPSADLGPVEREAIDAPLERMLTCSPSMCNLEGDWHRAWPLAKPFSVSPLPMELKPVWSQPQVDFWLDFLDAHPVAFHSLDVLDDVLIAMQLMPGAHAFAATAAVRQKLFRRVQDLLAPIINQPGTLPWVYAENRAALRLLVAAAFDKLDRSADGDTSLMQQMLVLNPNDNHGLRDIVVNELLFDGRDNDALALIANYPDDRMPAMMFGRVLANYRLGNIKEARRALNAANKQCPKVVKWLLPSSKAPPNEDTSRGILVGGDEEAWRYREATRDIWADTRGLLAWLKNNSK